MGTAYIAILLATGAGAGFASGLLGVGGGFVMVPVSYWVIMAMGVAQATAIKIAFGTSLLVILPTAISGAWKHNRNNAVEKKAALVLGLSGLVGALGGATLAAGLRGDILERGFGGLLLAASVWMALRQKVVSRAAKASIAEPDLFSRGAFRLLALCGLPIGFVVGLTGLGGGVLIVPILVLVFRFPIHKAIGTSLASIIFTSLGGIIGYILGGIGMSPLPYSIGYVNLPIWLCLAATSIPLAQLGSKTAHALPARQLEYIFIGLMAYFGLSLIGVVNIP